MPDTSLNEINYNGIKLVSGYFASQPLWQRVPTRTVTGELAFDFMIITRQLNKLLAEEQKTALSAICSVLNSYSKVMLLADLNLNINLLWISHLPRPHLCFEIASKIIEVYPLARLISHRSN